MASALVFFLAGIPTAVLVERIVRHLTATEDSADDTLAPKRLPWQADPWSKRLRIGLSVPVPFLAAASPMRFGTAEALAVSLLLVALIICTATDLLRYRVPNAVTYPGILLALLAAVLMPQGDLSAALIAALSSAAIFISV